MILFKVLKKYLPAKIKKNIYSLVFKRPVFDFYKTNYQKKVLVSYITHPFRRHSLSHTNYYAVTSAAKIFNELGYAVDVINYEGKVPNLEKYDVIYGFGDVFQKYFESGLKGKKTIYYGSGMHVCHQNSESLRRIKDVFERKGVWLARSARFVEKTWTHQTSLVDGIIALGNEVCKKSYSKFYDGKIIELPNNFFKTCNGSYILENKCETANKSFLWFGGPGLVHKGLDLCLDYFVTRPDLTLHICGNIECEPDFTKTYEKELFHTANIHLHGFVKIDSETFKDVLRSCAFLVFPSCSEGGCPGVLTVVGNGGLIPIISKGTSISTGYEIKINELSFDGFEEAIFEAEKHSSEEISNLQLKNLEYVLANHSQDVYYLNLKNAIKEIIYDEV